MKKPPVAQKSIFTILILALILALVPPIFAERMTGSLKGKITDKEGFPLPGAFIYLSSPSLIGIQNYITSDRGRYAFVQLAPGTYKMTVEMPGFKTVNIENIRVDVGKSVTLNILLESTDIEEEITSLQAGPLVDSQSAKIAFVADEALLTHSPLTRDFSSIVTLAPGIVPDETYPDRYFAVHGSSVRANTFLLGGANVTDPLTMAPLRSLNIDLIEEVEFETSAHPAETYPAEGGFINILTKSGGNEFVGNLKIYHTSQSLTKQLWPNSAFSDNNLAVPFAKPRHWDFSLNMGGPFIEDKAWFFSNFRLGFLSKGAPFSPWKDPLGTMHEAYSWRDRDLMAFFKVSAQVTSQIGAQISVYLTDRYQPVDESFLSINIPKESTQVLDHEKLFVATGSLNYKINQDTFVDVGLNLVNHKVPLLLNSGGSSLPSYSDIVTGQTWGSAPFNEKSKGQRIEASASIMRLQNSLMGINHELKAGAEYEDIRGELSTWKDNNLAVEYSSGSPYVFGTELSPQTGKAVGKGLISFYLAGKTEGNLALKTEMTRLGFFVQDAMTIGRRITLYLGLRYDRSAAYMPSLVKSASGNALSVKIGEALIVPLSDVNPFDNVIYPQWDPYMTWNSLSPRAGLSIDVLGNNRSILKASFSRYSDYLNLDEIQESAPFLPTRFHRFYWYDENGDGLVDATDTYTLFPEDYRIYKSDFFKKQVSPDAKAPLTDEWTIGFNQEILKNLSFSCEYTAKRKNNILENVLFDPDTGVEWYTTNAQAKNWWIPFTTIVPGTGDYQETPVTVYFRSNSAPAVFERLQNVPELKRKYGAFELTVRKRMSDNWQFYGSVVWSRAKGNIGLDAAASTGFTPAAGSPNYFVNFPEASSLDIDRPCVIKLLGTYRFPWDFYLTLFFSRSSGAPWARSVTILPPESWAKQNDALAVPVTVFLENPGTRRYSSNETLDVRIEKEFIVRNRKRLTLTMDVFNLLGHKFGLLDLNDGGFWFPDTENSSHGTRVISSTFEKTVSLAGSRKIQFSLNLQF